MGDFIKLERSGTHLKMRICRDHIKPYQKSMMENLRQRHKFEKALEREREREKERERERKRDRDRERDRDRDKERQRETERDRDRER